MSAFGLPNPCPPQTNKHMKMPHSPRGGRTLTLGIACLGFAATVFAQNETPRGTLTVDNTLVRVGAQSQLKWRIQYPQNVADVVEITPTKISPKENLKLRARIVGAKLKTNNGHGNNADSVDASNPGQGGTKTDSNDWHDDEIKSPSADLPVEVVWSKNQSAWSRIFYGTQGAIVPTNVVLDTAVAKGDVIDFGARGFITDWLPLYCTSSNCRNLLVLKNGDAAPPQIASKQYGQIEGFLKPYLSTDGRTVKIGALDLLILVELDQTNPLDVGFDYQDLGILVTFD